MAEFHVDRTGSNPDEIVTEQTIRPSKPVIEVLGKPIQRPSKSDEISLDEVIGVANEAKFANVAVYDLDQYLRTNGNCKRLEQKDFPYRGSVMVTDVNIAG